MFYKVIAAIVRPLVYILFFTKATFEAKLPEKGPVIYCQKHISMIDPTFLAVTQKHQLAFMGKAELFKFKPLGYILRKLNCFPVNRGKGDVAALKIALKVLNDGGVLCIMPEGTRNRRNHDLEMKTGAINLAYHTGATLVPVGMYTKNYKMSLFKKVHIRYGKPVKLSELGLQDGSKEELLRILNDCIKPEIIRLSEKDYIKR